MVVWGRKWKWNAADCGTSQGQQRVSKPSRARSRAVTSGGGLRKHDSVRRDQTGRARAERVHANYAAVPVRLVVDGTESSWRPLPGPAASGLVASCILLLSGTCCAMMYICSCSRQRRAGWSFPFAMPGRSASGMVEGLPGRSRMNAMIKGVQLDPRPAQPSHRHQVYCQDRVTGRGG